MSSEDKSSPRPIIKFVFQYTNDIVETVNFYTNILGLKEKGHSVEEGWIYYDNDTFNLVFQCESKQSPIYDDFARQPGHHLGSLEVGSFAIEYPESEFKVTVEKILKSNYRTLTEYPIWRNNSYWALTVMDNMGVSIELYMTPSDPPEGEDPVWKPHH